MRKQYIKPAIRIPKYETEYLLQVPSREDAEGILEEYNEDIVQENRSNWGLGDGVKKENGDTEEKIIWKF